MERSARFAAVLLLHHGGSVADEFSKNRDRLFAGTVEPINTRLALLLTLLPLSLIRDPTGKWTGDPLHKGNSRGKRLTRPRAFVVQATIAL